MYFLSKYNRAIINRTLYTMHISKYIDKRSIKCLTNVMDDRLKTQEIGFLCTTVCDRPKPTMPLNLFLWPRTPECSSICGQVVSLIQGPPVFSSQADLVLIFINPSKMMKGWVNLAQTWDWTLNLWHRSTRF